MKQVRRWYVQDLESGEMTEVSAATKESALKRGAAYFKKTCWGPVLSRKQARVENGITIEEYRDVYSVGGVGWYIAQPAEWEFQVPEWEEKDE